MAAESPALALRAAVRHHRRWHYRHTPAGRKPGPVTTCPDEVCQIAVARYLAAIDAERRAVKDGTDD